MGRTWRLSLISILGLLACELAFDLETTPNEDLFQVTLRYQEKRIIDTVIVHISWTEMTVENFKEFRIERKNMDHPDEGWLVIAQISNPFITSWGDTLHDDAIFKYRVGIYDTDDNHRTAEGEVRLGFTTHLIVPTEVDSIAKALGSPIIDDGDSVLVLPGLYEITGLDFEGKAVNLIGIGGATTTFIAGPESGERDSITVRMTAGLLQGFTIQAREAWRGGGVFASGSALVRRCIIRNNHSLRPLGVFRGGYGGGLYLSDSARVMNCVIYNNTADIAGGGIYVSNRAQAVRIVNCTIYGNESIDIFGSGPHGAGIDVAGSNGTIENCIVLENDETNIYPGPTAAQPPAVIYSNADSGWPEVDSTNISGDPLFVDFATGDFHLQPGSICSDAGNPDPSYNDADGSRNDMGAYGGPHGDW